MSSSALFATQRFCWFWKTLSPWVLHPKKQTFHQLSSTSSFNVCSQFASIVLPFSRMLMRKNVHSGIHIDIWDRYFGDLDQNQWFKITQIMLHQRNPWIHSGHGFIGSFAELWYEWYWIPDHDPGHPKGMLPDVCMYDAPVWKITIYGTCSYVKMFLSPWQGFHHGTVVWITFYGLKWQT